MVRRVPRYTKNAAPKKQCQQKLHTELGFSRGKFELDFVSGTTTRTEVREEFGQRKRAKVKKPPQFYPPAYTEPEFSRGKFELDFVAGTTTRTKVREECEKLNKPR